MYRECVTRIHGLYRQICLASGVYRILTSFVVVSLTDKDSSDNDDDDDDDDDTTTHMKVRTHWSPMQMKLCCTYRDIDRDRMFLLGQPSKLKRNSRNGKNIRPGDDRKTKGMSSHCG
ncbi:hypothetical protein V1477_020853 [Vespula maculifrons]|uniref:Uncharacterized protein n=1 Tax=Vespula maculifrons TaxID=7453 RepID=A0ABD2AN30_VESMC